MTTQEKAKRYDALQIAIDFHIDNINRQIVDSMGYIERKINPLLEGYHTGKKDAYKEVIEILRRFKN